MAKDTKERILAAPEKVSQNGCGGKNARELTAALGPVSRKSAVTGLCRRHPGAVKSMGELVMYIHGKGGSAAECEHYRPLFPDCEVVGLDYQTSTPWETGAEIHDAVTKLEGRYESITLIANSIGAFFTMNAGIDEVIDHAFFISPIVDMERLICEMMAWAGVTEEQLREKGLITTAFGEDLSWTYLSYVREHPVQWNAPTAILYGSGDNLTDGETIAAFAKAHSASLTVMEGGEHWFHTKEQMRFLDTWITGKMI